MDTHRLPSRKWLLQPNYSAPLGRTDCCTEELSCLVFAALPGALPDECHTAILARKAVPGRVSQDCHRHAVCRGAGGLGDTGTMNPPWVQ